MQNIHVLKAINFLSKYPNEWHTFAKDKLTEKTVKTLVTMGKAEVNIYHQFRII